MILDTISSSSYSSIYYSLFRILYIYSDISNYFRNRKHDHKPDYPMLLFENKFKLKFEFYLNILSFSLNYIIRF